VQEKLQELVQQPPLDQEERETLEETQCKINEIINM